MADFQPYRDGALAEFSGPEGLIPRGGFFISLKACSLRQQMVVVR